MTGPHLLSSSGRFHVKGKKTLFIFTIWMVDGIPMAATMMDFYILHTQALPNGIFIMYQPSK